MNFSHDKIVIFHSCVNVYQRIIHSFRPYNALDKWEYSIKLTGITQFLNVKPWWITFLAALVSPHDLIKTPGQGFVQLKCESDSWMQRAISTTLKERLCVFSNLTRDTCTGQKMWCLKKNLLVCFYAGNFLEWSIITSNNHPTSSNKPIPIHSLRLAPGRTIWDNKVWWFRSGQSHCMYNDVT